jgi:GMP synthase-like glutamine amidotransferase
MRAYLVLWISFITCSVSLQQKACILVINCEDIKWNPITFSDMFITNMGKNDDSFTTCNIACGQDLPKDMDQFQGIIITGSHYNCRPRDSYFEWYEGLLSLIREISFTGKPNLYGSCFGHNLIALALGGKIGPNPNNKYILEIEQLKMNKQFYGSFSSISPLKNIKEIYSVISTHEDCVLELPESATLLGSTLHCENHLYVTGKNRNILACQSHPEFNHYVHYAVMDRIWVSIVNKRKCLSAEEVAHSRKSFEEYTTSDSTLLCDMISDFLRTSSIVDP